MGVSVFPEAGFLPGMVMPYAGAIAPGGWLLCDGSVLTIAAYPGLYAVIGTKYNVGGETSLQFRLPNLKGKIIAGQDVGQTEFAALGQSGGSKTSTAPHTHSLSDHRHAIEGHVHGFATDFRDTNHAHNVYARDTNHDHAINHWHVASIGSANVKAWSGFSHEHLNSGGTASEGAAQGATGAGAIPVNVDGTAQAAPNGNNISGSMRQNWSHDHPSTNYASESPWPGNYNHQHAGTTYDIGSPTGWQPPNINVSGASSAEAISGNLPPYLTLNYLIKV